MTTHEDAISALARWDASERLYRKSEHAYHEYRKACREGGASVGTATDAWLKAAREYDEEHYAVRRQIGEILLKLTAEYPFALEGK